MSRKFTWEIIALNLHILDCRHTKMQRCLLLYSKESIQELCFLLILPHIMKRLSHVLAHIAYLKPSSFTLLVSFHCLLFGGSLVKVFQLP